MVKIGFIVEGFTEKIILESENFKSFAKKNGIEICNPIQNAQGGGNLLPNNIIPYVKNLKKNNAKHIVILTDLENETNVAVVKNRIGSAHTNLIFVAVKAIEAWFLADTQALRSWLKKDNVFEAHPERTPDMPWEFLKSLAQQHQSRGPGSSKTAFAKQMCQRHSFDLSRAAQHPACPSVKEFHDELLKLGGV
ncbi:MAG: hypothetical protein RIR79_1022 [Pseudomonadota bacterium]|jgi:hypothetical protein